LVIDDTMATPDQEREHNLSAAELIARAEAEGLALHASLSALPKSEQAPEWITVFPKGGAIATRDGRSYQIDSASLIAAFTGDGIDIPVDVNHATDAAGIFGGRADAMGWIAELRASKGGGVEARVEWLEEGEALIKSRKYRYTSPTFYHDKSGRATRLKAVALVTAPALANQTALAAARARSTSKTETSMNQIAEALGLQAGASEAECLSSLTALRAGLVPKADHEQALAQLSAATTEVAALKAASREAKVGVLIEAALTAKKILPAEKEHYMALCSTDEGLEQVSKLFAAKVPVLEGSGLDRKAQLGAGKVDATDGVALGAAASAYMAEQAAKGITISATEAVQHLTGAN
jgi:phage I-like protein